MARRNGVGMQFGFRWTLGKKESATKTSSNNKNSKDKIVIKTMK